MMYKKCVQNGYIVCAGNGGMGEEITEEEYNAIMAAFAERPFDTDEKGYRLTEALVWEEYSKTPEPPDPDPELDDEELVNVLLGEGFEI